MERRKIISNIATFDLSMNALLGFIWLFMIAYVQINQNKQQTVSIETEGKFMVTIRWSNDSIDDVDLYVRDSVGNIAFFKNRDSGLMHLEHDDLGIRGDTIKTANGEIQIERNEERVIIRGIVPGEYIVNVHMYRKEDPLPTPVTITLNRLIGQDEQIISRERILEQKGDEQTAFRFTLDEKGVVSGITELPFVIVPKAAERYQRGNEP